MTTRRWILLGVGALLLGGAGVLTKVLLFPRPVLRLVYRVETAGVLRDRLRLIAGELADQGHTTRQQGEALVAPADDAAARLLATRYREVLESRPVGEQPGALRLRLAPAYVEQVRRAALHQALLVVRARAKPLGRGVEVRLRGQELLVELPRMPAEDVEAFQRVVRISAHLEFRIVDDETTFVRRAIARRPLSEGVRVKHNEYEGRSGTVRYLTLVSGSSAQLRDYVDKLPDTLRPPPEREILFGESWGPHGRRTLFELYIVHRRAALTGEQVQHAEAFSDEATGRPEVSLTFSAEGGQRLEALSRANVGRRLAIVLDGQVTSAPVITAPITGGKARISVGGFKDAATLQLETRDLALALRSGMLPARLVLLRSEPL